jgi:hypothetical protein
MMGGGSGFDGEPPMLGDDDIPFVRYDPSEVTLRDRWEPVAYPLIPDKGNRRFPCPFFSPLKNWVFTKGYYDTDSQCNGARPL